jgi:hypothetical protein
VGLGNLGDAGTRWKSEMHRCWLPGRRDIRSGQYRDWDGVRYKIKFRCCIMLVMMAQGPGMMPGISRFGLR